MMTVQAVAKPQDDVSQSAASHSQQQCSKILALHGKGSSGQDFVSRLDQYHEVLRENHDGMTMHVVALTAPFPLVEDNTDAGFQWWALPPFARSFNATTYEGFQTSAELVLKTLREQGPFDCIYGHSKGAILIAALLALERIPDHPTRGYVLNGCAWPNPYSDELKSLKFPPQQAPNLLFITGLKDDINAPDTQAQVKESLEAAGARVSQIFHSGGHNIPIRQSETLTSVIEWMVQSS